MSRLTINKKIRRQSFCPGEIDFCRGQILEKLGRGKESAEHYVNAVNAGNSRAKCLICRKATEFIEADVTEETINQFVVGAAICGGDLNFCLAELSTELSVRAQISISAEERETLLRNALIVDEIAIKVGSWIGYFNKACDLSVMAQNGMRTERASSLAISYDPENMKREILFCLAKAFAQKPALAKYCLTDNDLDWVKENCAKEFFELMGRTYANHYAIL